MVPIHRLTETFAVAGQLDAADFAAIAKAGFKSVIGNRPDGEERDQPTMADCAAAAETAGLHFLALPMSMSDVLEPEAAKAMADAIAGVPQPALAYCKSGVRSAIVWAAGAIATEPVEGVIAALEAADFQIPGLASELRVRAALT